MRPLARAPMESRKPIRRSRSPSASWAAGTWDRESLRNLSRICRESRAIHPADNSISGSSLEMITAQH